MGDCGSSPLRQPEDDDKKFPEKKDAVATSEPFKLLLFGRKHAGKSTIFMQMNLRYDGLDRDHRIDYVDLIHENVLWVMKILLNHNQIQPKACGAAQRVLNFPNDAQITSDIASDIATLWKDQGIKATFRRRSEFFIPDNLPHFFERVNELAKADYVPTDQDLVKCRDRTTGIHSLKFDVPGLKDEFTIYDCGGTRFEMKRYVRCFKGTRAVLFVVAISEYNEVSFEDNTSLLLDEELLFFTRVVQSMWFVDVRFILLFNKVDLFKSKLADGIPYKFGGYCGTQDFYGITKHVVRTFMSKNEQEREVVPLFVSASEPDFDCMEILREATGYFQRRDWTSDALNDAVKELLLDIQDIVLDYLFVY